MKKKEKGILATQQLANYDEQVHHERGERGEKREGLLMFY